MSATAQTVDLDKIFGFLGEPDAPTKLHNNRHDNAPSILPTIKNPDVPALPDYARLTPAQLELATDAGAWLDDYIAFATEASPLTPRSFHEAAGLFAGSLMIARRLHLPVSTESNWIFPNLYLLFVGQSTRPRKTTALKVLQGLISEAGLGHFLRPGRNTPEVFIADSGTQLPRDFDEWQPDAQQTFLRERAIAAQRGLLLEEASHLLDSFSRDFTSGLLPLVMDLYDCGEEVAAKLTISRGREGINNAYLSIFGATTYGSMAEHFSNPILWHNGLFARFGFVGSDTDGSWRFWPANTPYPTKLTGKLRFIAERLFPMPCAEVVETEAETDDGDMRKVKRVDVSPLESSAAIITPEAWAQWERYSRAVSYDMIPEEPRDVDPQFYANYGRLGTMLIKVAMILAVFDADCLPVRVEAKHVYRAQMICEGWRAALHSIAIHTDDVTGANLVTRIKAVIAEAGNDWIAGREIYKKLRLKRDDVTDVLNDLVEAGEVETRRQGKSDQYRLKRG